MTKLPRIGQIHKNLMETGKLIMTAWSNDYFYMVPYTASKEYPLDDIRNAASRVFRKSMNGYSMRVEAVHQTSPETGWIELSEYNGIGD